MTQTAIIGAGIVGICCAIALAEQGHEVTLIDRATPGQQTSRWNAGVLATSSVIPLNNPDLFAKLPRLLTGRHPGFHMNWAVGPRLLPWVVQFLRNSRKARAEHSIAALANLIGQSRRDHEALCVRIGFQGLRQSGWLMLYRSKDGPKRAELQARTLAEREVAVRGLTGSELAELEPGLKPVFSGALHITQSAHTHPATLSAAYLAHAKSLGVRVLCAEATQIIPSDARPGVGTKAGDAGRFDHVVLAMGAWSNDLLKPLGTPLPMVIERGYLQVFQSQTALNRPFFDVDGGYVAAARPGGIQVSTGTELTRLCAPANPKHLRTAVRAARQALPLGAAVSEDVAVGNRPSLPDSLPVIGRIRALPGLWIAAGHQHVGFSTSAGTASLLAALINNHPPKIDPTPFDPKRYGL